MWTSSPLSPKEVKLSPLKWDIILKNISEEEKDVVKQAILDNYLPIFFEGSFEVCENEDGELCFYTEETLSSEFVDGMYKTFGKSEVMNKLMRDSGYTLEDYISRMCFFDVYQRENGYVKVEEMNKRLTLENPREEIKFEEDSKSIPKVLDAGSGVEIVSEDVSESSEASDSEDIEEMFQQLQKDFSSDPSDMLTIEVVDRKDQTSNQVSVPASKPISYLSQLICSMRDYSGKCQLFSPDENIPLEEDSLDNLCIESGDVIEYILVKKKV